MQELRKRRKEEKKALQQVECLPDFEREFVKAEQKEKKHREDLERATDSCWQPPPSSGAARISP